MEQQPLKLSRFMAFKVDIWWMIALIIAAVVMLPIGAVIYIAVSGTQNTGSHFLSSAMPRYLMNSLVLMAGVAAMTCSIGTVSAWLIVTFEFPFRRYLDWLLLIPLAIPAYIGAYALVDFLEFAGPFQTMLRSVFGWGNAQEYWFPEIRSRSAAIIVLSLSLYPYVYLFARNAFYQQSASATEVSRALGSSAFGSFFRITLPMARPAVVAGLAIVMMETLNDFGAVEYFAVQTLTTGIFTTWLERSDAAGAAQIASAILGLVAILVLLERYGRRRARYHQTPNQKKSISREKLSPVFATIAFLFCVTPVVFGFVLPVWVLLGHMFGSAGGWSAVALWQAAATSFVTSSMAAVITVIAAICLIYAVNLSRHVWFKSIIPITTIGYAAPGAVLALGILIPFSWIDHRFADLWQSMTGVDPGLIITGSMGGVVLAYCIRFFAIPQASLDAAFDRITPNIGHAARSLGKGPGSTLGLIHLPLIRNSILAAALLVFVDAAKELPATLLLRPFGFNTLATEIYEKASREDIAGATPAALIVICLSLAAVILLARSLNGK